MQFGDRILVTDPCYQRDTWCTEILKCVPGSWLGEIKHEINEGRVAEIMVWNIKHNYLIGKWRKVTDKIGVDSGQCGFFNLEKYPTDPKEFEYFDNTFYGIISNNTLANRISVHNDWYCSDSGYGDGCYPLYVKETSEGLVYAAKLQFIFDEEEEDI